MTTSPHKLLSSLIGKVSALTVLLMVAGISFTAPSAMAQQIALTPEELDQQNRLQNTIAATNRNLEQGEKEVNGVVFTPRWSNPVWVEADSLSILFVYCLPGEFADSGQEILGGSQLEVLESYALALTGDLMVWFAVVENEDEQNRLPAAVGVICASDLNQAETRVLSPSEQQQINNIVQQFVNIQNTQVTNIDQVIDIINNVTTNATTGPVTPPPPPTNDTVTPPPTNDTVTPPPPPPTNDTVTPPPNGNGGVLPPPETGEEGQPPGGGVLLPLRAEIIPNATQAVAPATIKLDADITGGAPPYSYSWSVPDRGMIDQDRSITQMFFEPGTFTYILTATDSNGQTVSDSVQIVIRERLSGGVLPPPETGEEGQPPGGGLLPLIPPPPPNATGEAISPPEGGESLPTNDTGGG
jgi:hypothetical protein